jgi:oligoendopeptidase F
MVKQIVRRAGSARKGTKKVQPLPQWSLSDLYTSPDDKKISSDLRKAKKQAEAFRRKYAGTLAKVSRSPVRFKNLLAEYEAIMLLASKPYHYASLLFAESALETGRGGLLQMARTRYVEIVNLLAFFHPEVLSISKQRLRQLSDPAYTLSEARVA